jgi:hypothetical protein
VEEVAGAVDKMTTKLLSIFIFVLFRLTLVSAQSYGNCPMGSFGGVMYGFSGEYGTTTMLFSWLTGILIIVALILLILWLLNQINKNKK